MRLYVKLHVKRNWTMLYKEAFKDAAGGFLELDASLVANSGHVLIQRTSCWRYTVDCGHRKDGALR